MSFDDVSITTSIPLKIARAIVLDKLGNDRTLEDHTNLTITELTEALEICLTSAYFHTITFVTEKCLALP